MTAKEAIELIEQTPLMQWACIRKDGRNAGDIAKALFMAIKVLRKQNPQKVLFEDIGYDYWGNENVYGCICPSCGLHIIRFCDSDVESRKSDDPEQMFHDCLVHHDYRGLNNYCNRCGQKLDWG